MRMGMRGAHLNATTFLGATALQIQFVRKDKTNRSRIAHYHYLGYSGQDSVTKGGDLVSYKPGAQDVKGSQYRIGNNSENGGNKKLHVP